jgi:xylulose-5-phosphate/fructose-6-phosphate phosphoketolase
VGTSTTPFARVVLNELDRFHLVEEAIDRLPRLGAGADYFKKAVKEKRIEHKPHIQEQGDDTPDLVG